MTSVNVALVQSAVHQLLAAEMPCPVGLGAIPSPAVDEERRPGLTEAGKYQGYLIVYMIPAGARLMGGSYCGQPESMRWVRFQLTGVGIQADQAAHVAAMAAGVLVDRGDSTPFAWVHTLTVPGHSIVDRVTAGDIPLDHEAGVFQAGALVDLLVEVA